MVACNVLIPQLFWLCAVRRNLLIVFIVSLFINLGMWFERFIIIVASLQRDFLPSAWSDYRPTSIEIATFIGTLGLFFTLFLLFCRFVPVIAIAEIKGVLRPAHGSHPAHDSQADREDISPEHLTLTGRLLVSVFEREDDVVRRRPPLGAKGWRSSTYAPCTIHGSIARWLEPSGIPWVCFLLGLFGAVTITIFQFWRQPSWQINVGGKP
jgi:hypothetical protein